MLQLRKVQILGFKSFCDRTEIPLEGRGIAAVVGPNGCGKSNISDAITWVLGEQSAKSLRGAKMEDVIFAGTRDRRPTGMAEVSLTLVDPAVFEDPGASQAAREVHPEVVGDWNEDALRRQAAQETQEAIQEAQPGQVDEAAAEGQGLQIEAGDDPAREEDGVVLKVRRRKFGKTPPRAGEITVTRRLFRSGESEYLLNGKICRLRDIQDIFLGTGLGGDSYAIIGQERVGQLLSSKPLDRRILIEEAAGITRFKAKKRLAELRLESAKGNLSRVNDIFEEVTRQVTVLKRQAAKAERFAELRAEFTSRWRVVLASRLAQMDAESEAVHKELERLGSSIGQQADQLATLDSEHNAGTVHGYELDRALRDATSQASRSAVELERIQTRITANGDRQAELAQRVDQAALELEGARDAMLHLAGEREQHRSFLEMATAEAATHRINAQAQQQRAQDAIRGVVAAEQQAEASRRSALQALQRANTARNEVAQAEAALAGFERENQRLRDESEVARTELASLGHQRGQAKLAFEDVTERLKRLEAELVDLRGQMEQRRTEETGSRRRGDGLRAELATLLGRRSSLEALIREHSYSTDTVRNLFRADARRAQGEGGVGSVGTLADFLEVDGRYETVVDEFLRDELNYIVVKSWQAANEGVRLLHGDVAGRATFLVHPSDAQAAFPFAEGMSSVTRPDREGIVPLTQCVRVLDGFGRSLEVILPRLREGFITPDAETARSLALAHPQSFFLAPSGETFHNVTVTGGKPRTQGPLALKRELADVQRRMETLERDLAQNEQRTAALARELGEITAAMDTRNHQRRDTERESANSGAAMRQIESEAGRLERRLGEWQLALARNQDQRGRLEEVASQKRSQAESFEAERARFDAHATEQTAQLATLRAEREELQAAASSAHAALAGLEERRRYAVAHAERTERLHIAQVQRVAQIESGITQATAERARREEENVALLEQVTQLSATREAAAAAVEQLATEADALRRRLNDLNAQLRTLRQQLDALREQRAVHAARQARLGGDLEHLEAVCISDLSLEAQALRADPALSRVAGEALAEQDEAARALRKKMDAMGPVNMMALDELREASERHDFLETQRRDLLDAIENTAASIREIEDVSREKFDEAFRLINENFSTTFMKLFGGGQAFMRLTETEDAKENDLAGLDILVSPPGKKLQNVLLLSGGEKALTALALLVATFMFQPAPFCVLDEVDAPLDETNTGRFARLVAEMSNTTQFVVITHSKRTMEQADIMYGVTMQEPGVSKIVSVSLGGGSQGKRARSAA